MSDLGLIADIGGTNARFALADADGIHQKQTLGTQDFNNIEDAIRAYQEMTGTAGKIDKACVAIAGPVRGDWFEMTNFKWKFSIEKAGQNLGFSRFAVINDFEAVALAVPNLPPEEYRKIGRGGIKKTWANMVVLGPGTGLGSAGIICMNNRYMPVASESQHGEFGCAVGEKREFEIFATIRKIRPEYTVISPERACSGKGLANIYAAIQVLDGKADDQDMAPEEISRRALDGTCPNCTEALDLMMKILGRFAGNMAMTFCAFGGVYIAGGIPGKLGKYFDNSSFREAFELGGTFNGFNTTIPTYLITREDPAFLGLQHKVLEMARDKAAA